MWEKRLGQGQASFNPSSAQQPHVFPFGGSWADVETQAWRVDSKKIFPLPQTIIFLCHRHKMKRKMFVGGGKIMESPAGISKPKFLFFGRLPSAYFVFYLRPCHVGKQNDVRSWMEFCSFEIYSCEHSFSNLRRLSYLWHIELLEPPEVGKERIGAAARPKEVMVCGKMKPWGNPFFFICGFPGGFHFQHHHSPSHQSSLLFHRSEKIPWEGEFTFRSDSWAGLIASWGSFYPMTHAPQDKY